MTRQIIDSLHRCLCPQFFNSLPIRTHSSVAVLSTKRLSPLSRVTRSFSSPSLTVPSQFTPETESQSGTSIYSQPPIRKILKVPTGTRRVARERFRGDSYIKYRLPPPEYSGINKVIDLVGQSVYPDIFLAAEELVRYEGYVPDAKLYTILIEACANFPGCLFQPLAFQLLGEMKERGLQPNSAIYHSLLRLLATSPDYLKRSAILEEMKQGWYTLTDEGWQNVISGYILDGHLEMALEIIEKRRRNGQALHRNSYKDIIQGLCAVGEMDEALRLIRELEAGITWVTPPALAYSLLVAATSQLHLEATLFCWRKIIDREMFSPDDGLCLATLNVAARYGDPPLASDVFRVLGNRGLRFEEHHYAALLESYAVAGDIASAFSVLSIMRRAGVTPSENTARPVITRLPDLAAIQGAFGALKQVKGAGRDVDLAAINAIIAAHVVHKDIDEAFEVYKEMPDFDLRPETSTFNILFKGAALQGKVGFARNLVSEMKEMKIEPNAMTYEHLFYTSLTQNDYEDAFVYLEEMKPKWSPKPSMYKRLAEKCFLVGDQRYRVALKELRNMGINTAVFMEELMGTQKMLQG